MLTFLRRYPKRSLVRSCITQSWLSTASENVHLRIIFGSQSGTAEAFAYDLEFDAQEANISTEIVDALKFTADEMAAKPDDSKKVVNAFIMACYGEGEPTDNAKKFFHSVDNVPADAKTKFQGSKYAVFGLGNSQCFRDRYNVIGKKLDKVLHQKGGDRLIPLGLGDASMTGDGSESMSNCFAAWKKDLISSIGNLSSTPSSNTNDETKIKDSNSSSSAGSELTAKLHHTGSDIPMVLSARQRAMIPAHRTIYQSTVSHVTQLFAETDELTGSVEVEFDLQNTTPLFTSPDAIDQSNLTAGLQAGDHIGVFAPNSPHVIDRFALAAGLNTDDLDTVVIDTAEEGTATLRQILTWQVHLSGLVSSTTIKLLQRWLTSQPHLPLTAKLFGQLEKNYESLVRDKGLDTADVLEMIPKIPIVTGGKAVPLPVMVLVKTLPTLNPRLYSMTHMVIPSNRALASVAAATFCPISKTFSKPSSPTAMDDYSKITLLCRLVRYRQTKSSRNRIIDGVSSSYLTERLTPGTSQVAIFFRESNFHLPPPVPTVAETASSAVVSPPPPVIMIAGGSGLAPFMSFLEERQRLLHQPSVQIGPSMLFFGCRTKEEYMFRDKLVSYLGPSAEDPLAKHALDKLVVSFSNAPTMSSMSSESRTSPLHPKEVVHPVEQHIPNVVREHKDQLIHWIRQGAYVYVCGGAGLFGKAVRAVVNDIAMEAFALDTNKLQAAGADQTGIRALVAEKRYFEDLAD